MVYTPQTWVDGTDGGTPLSAARLNHAEAGIKDASDRLTSVESAGYQNAGQVTGIVTSAVTTAVAPKASTSYVDAADTALGGRLTAVESALPAKANTSSLAAVATSGNAADLTGVLPTSALPALSITDVYTVANQAAMLNLTAQRGDVAIRTDTAATYILAAEPAATLGNWKLLPTPADAVLSVQGQIGAVVLGKGDIGLSEADNTSDAAKPVSTATQAALATKADRFTPVTLPFSATVNSDASTARHFRITATGDFTLANPSGAHDGDKLVYEVRQDANGGRVPALGSMFNTGGTTLPWSSAPDKVDYLGGIYRATGPNAPQVDVVAFRPGL
jgi:hypothetical protein